VNLASAHDRARSRIARVLGDLSEEDTTELLDAGRAGLIFSGMDIDATILNAIADAYTLQILNVCTESPEVLVGALQGAFVEGILFGYEIRSAQ